MDNEELYFYLSCVGVAWMAVSSGFIIWLTDQNNKNRSMVERVDDRVTHVYDELHKLDSKVNVKEAIQEALEEAATKED